MKKKLIYAGILFLSVCAMNAEEDPFLWLEEVEGEEALAWAEKNNEKTFQRLKGDIRFEAAEEELLSIYEDPEKIPYIAIRGDYVYNFWRDGKHVQGIYRRTTMEEFLKASPQWESLIDLDRLSKEEGKTWVYKGITCLYPEERYCMVRLSDGGSDAAESREFDLLKKEFVQENAFRIPESKHRLTWVDKDHLYIGYDYGPDSLTDSGYPRTARLWKRGTPIESAKLVFEGNKSDVSVGAWRSSNPKHKFTVFYQSLDFYNSNSFVLFDEEEAMKQIEMPTHVSIRNLVDDVFLLSPKKAWKVDPEWGIESEIPAGSLVTLNIKAVQTGDYQNSMDLVWVPDERSSLQSVSVTQDYVLLNLIRNVKSEGYRASKKEGKWELEKLPLPENGNLSFTSTKYDSSKFLYYFESFLTPESLFLFDINDSDQKKLKSKKAYFDASDFITEQFEATSKDGTQVPYFIVRVKDLRFDGNNPTYMYGYGGFQVNMKPSYSSTLGTQWLAKGGVYVLTNIRGGGEFGPKWHQAALKEKRQTAYDDFHAVAEDLIQRKITSPQKLAIGGGSNGGLLVGVAFTQRPELYQAVACSVPLLDMVRYHKLLAGASWMGEYGNPDVAEELDYILKYSPYQNLDPDVEYPEVYFFTSTKDDRVHPGHARKMVARMQEQGHKVLYYENIEGGHGGAANLKQSAMQQAMKYVYFWQKTMD